MHVLVVENFLSEIGEPRRGMLVRQGNIRSSRSLPRHFWPRQVGLLAQHMPIPYPETCFCTAHQTGVRSLLGKAAMGKSLSAP
jgi:hypothetical protein